MRDRSLILVLLLVLAMFFSLSSLVNAQEPTAAPAQSDAIETGGGAGERLSEGISALVDKYSNLIMVLIYVGFAVILVCFARLFVKNFRNLYVYKDRFYGEELKEVFRDETITWEVYLNRIKEFKTANPSMLMESLYAAAMQCEDKGSPQRYYDLTAFRIEKEFERSTDVGQFYTLATASPAVGFLGTLIGMTVILKAGVTAEVMYYSKGLLYAINTSIIGLIILAFSMAAAFIFANRKEKIQTEMLRIASAIAERVTRKLEPQHVD